LSSISIILNAQEARDNFERGFEPEAFNCLEDITKTIAVLKDFKSKYAALVGISVIVLYSCVSYLFHPYKWP